MCWLVWVKFGSLIASGSDTTFEAILSTSKLGLLTQLVPEGRGLAAAIAFVEKLVNGPLLAYEMAKEQNNRINYGDFEEYLFKAEKETVGKTFRSEGYREAVTAFLEKRATHYRGR